MPLKASWKTLSLTEIFLKINATEGFLKTLSLTIENQCHWRLLEKHWVWLKSSWKSDWIWLKASWKTLSLTEVFLKNRLNLTEGFLTNWSTESFLTDSLSCESGESRAHRRWQHLASEEVASSRHSESNHTQKIKLVRQLSENHTQKNQLKENNH